MKILIAENDEGEYQVVGVAAGMAEAIELAREYAAHPSCDNLCPEIFVLVSQSDTGAWTHRQEIEL